MKIILKKKVNISLKGNYRLFIKMIGLNNLLNKTLIR